MPILNLSAVFYLLIVVFVIVIFLGIYFKQKFCYWKNKNVYTEQPQIPFGNAYNLVQHKHSHGEEFQKVYDSFKNKRLRFGGYYAFAKPLFIPTELDLIKNILINNFEHFTDHITFVDENVEPLAVNLITLKGLQWKRLRTKLTPSFTTVKMKTMFPTLLNCSTNLCAAFEDQTVKTGTSDVRDIIARYTTDVIGSCVFGLDCNSLYNPDDTFRQVGKLFFDVTTTKKAIIQLLSFLTPGLLAFFKIPLIDRKVKDSFTQIVKNNVEYREKHNITRNDILHVLIEMKNDYNDDKFTMNQLIAQCLLFFLAGFETTSTATTYCLYELATNFTIQNKLRSEVMDVIAKYQGEITYDALAEMTYMDQCIYETLRKYPPIPVHTRECTKPYQIPNTDVILEKGTYVMIPVVGIHRDPEHYPDPDKFNPDRFTKENRANRHACAWIPFGAGPRVCIAERFGILQIKVCLSALLRKYKLSLNAKMQKPLTFDRRSTTILVPNEKVLLDIHELI